MAAAIGVAGVYLAGVDRMEIGEYCRGHDKRKI